MVIFDTGREMQAISIDGTVIECDEIKQHNQGIILKKKQAKQAVKDESKSQKSSKSESSKSEKSSKSESSGGSQKSGQKQKKSGGSQSRTIGFIPYRRLMYVVPDDVSYNIEDFEEVPV